jgi:hypothetical protein
MQLRAFLHATSLTVLFFLVAGTAQAETVNLTEDEAKTAQDILRRDKLLKALSTSQEGLAGLAKLLSIVIDGPLSIAVSWDQAQIALWREANSSQSQKTRPAKSSILNVF